MATTLFNNEPLVSGVDLVSQEILSVGDLVLDAEILNGVNFEKVKIRVEAAEGANSLKPVVDENLRRVEVQRTGPAGVRINIFGVNAEKATVIIKVPSGVEGSITLVATGSVNPNSDLTLAP